MTKYGLEFNCRHKIWLMRDALSINIGSDVPLPFRTPTGCLIVRRKFINRNGGFFGTRPWRHVCLLRFSQRGNQSSAFDIVSPGRRPSAAGGRYWAIV